MACDRARRSLLALAGAVALSAFAAGGGDASPFGPEAGLPQRTVGFVGDPWHSDEWQDATGSSAAPLIENFVPFGSRALPTERLSEARRRGLTVLIAWLPREPAAVVSPHVRQPLFANTRIAAGAEDAYIRAFAQACAAYPDVPVLLRYAPEMDGAWEPWHRDPAGYVRAWRHVVSIFRAEHAANVSFLWTTALPAPGDRAGRAWLRTARRYWPGSRYVDYVGASTVDRSGRSPRSMAARLRPLARFHKPAVLPEVYAPAAVRSSWLPAFAAEVARLPFVRALLWVDLDRSHPLTAVPADARAFAAFADPRR